MITIDHNKIPPTQPTLALDTTTIAIPTGPAAKGPSSSATPALPKSATTERPGASTPKAMRPEERHPFRRTQSSGAPNTPTIETSASGTSDVNRAPKATMSATANSSSSDSRRRTSFPVQSAADNTPTEPRGSNGVAQRVPSQTQSKPSGPAANGNAKGQGSTSASPIPQSASTFPGVNQVLDRQQTEKNISNVLRTTIESIQAPPFLKFQIEEVQRRSDDVDVGRYPKQLQELANQAKVLKAQELEAKAKSTAFGDVFGQQLMEILRTYIASTVQSATMRPSEVTQADLDLIVSEQSTWRKVFEQAQQKEVDSKLEEVDTKFKSLLDVQIEAVKLKQKNVDRMEDDIKDYITNRLGESNYACNLDAQDIRTSISDLASDYNATKVVVEEIQRAAAAKEAEQETDQAALFKQMQERMDMFDTTTKDLEKRLKSEASERQALQAKLDAEVSARQDLNAKYTKLLSQDSKREKEVAKLREDYKDLKPDRATNSAVAESSMLLNRMNVLEAKYLALQAAHIPSNEPAEASAAESSTRLENGLSQLEVGLKQIEANKDNLRRVAVWLEKYSHSDETALAMDKSLRNGLPNLDRLAVTLGEVTSEMLADQTRFAQVQSATQGIAAAITTLQTAWKELKGRWGDDEEEEEHDEDDLPSVGRRRVTAPTKPSKSAADPTLQALEKNVQTLTNGVSRVAELLSSSNPSNHAVQEALTKHEKDLTDLHESIKEFSSKSDLQIMQDQLRTSGDRHSSRLDRVDAKMKGLDDLITTINDVIRDQVNAVKKLQEAQSTAISTSTPRNMQSPTQVASPGQSSHQNSMQTQQLQSQLLQTQAKLTKLEVSTQTKFQQLSDHFRVLQAQTQAPAQTQGQGQRQGQVPATNAQPLQQSLYVLQRQVNALQQSQQNLTTQQIFRAVNEEVVSLFGPRLDKVEATSSALMVQYGARPSAEAQEQRIEAACGPLRASINKMQEIIQTLKEAPTNATAAAEPAHDEEVTKLRASLDALETSFSILKNDFTQAIKDTALQSDLTGLKTELESKIETRPDEVKKLKDSLTIYVTKHDLTQATGHFALQKDLTSLKSELANDLETKSSAQRSMLTKTALQHKSELRADVEERLSFLQVMLDNAKTEHCVEIDACNETLEKHVKLYDAVVTAQRNFSERLTELEGSRSLLEIQFAELSTRSSSTSNTDLFSKQEAKQTKVLEEFRQEIQAEVNSNGQLLREQINANAKTYNERVIEDLKEKDRLLQASIRDETDKALAKFKGMPDQMKILKETVVQLEHAQNKSSSELVAMRNAQSKADADARHREGQLFEKLTGQTALLVNSRAEDFTAQLAESEKSLVKKLSGLQDSYLGLEALSTSLKEAQAKYETQLGEGKTLTQVMTYDRLALDKIVADLRQEIIREALQVRDQIPTEINRLLDNPANKLNEIQQKIAEGQSKLNEVVLETRQLLDEVNTLYRKTRDALKTFGAKKQTKEDMRNMKICVDGFRKDVISLIGKKIRSWKVMLEDYEMAEPIDSKEAIPESPTEIPSAITGRIFGSAVASTPGSPRATPLSNLPKSTQNGTKQVQATGTIPLGFNGISQSGHSRASSGSKSVPIPIFESDEEDQEVAPAKPLSTPFAGKFKHKSKLKSVKSNDAFDVPESEDELLMPSAEKLRPSTHSHEPSSRPMTAVSTSSTASKRKATGEQRSASSKMQRTTSQGDRKAGGLLGTPAGRNSGGLIKQSPPAAKGGQSKKASGPSKKG